MSNRRIVCPSCNTIFSELLLKQKGSENQCLICGASLNVDESESAPEPELIDWYYYDLGGGSGYLDDVFMEDDESSKLAYKFKAPKDLNKAKEVLRREYKPDAFMESETSKISTKPDPVVRCPRCRSTSIQLVPRKFSIWTGYRTNKVDRVCINCKHRW